MGHFFKSLEALILSSPFIFNSCNVLERITEDKNKTDLRKQGYNPYHVRACGPASLQELFEKYETKLEKEDISKEILEKGVVGNIFRTILAISHNDAMQITWPWELERMLDEHLDHEKYNIHRITGHLQKTESYLKTFIRKNKTGIALIKQEKNNLDYHWIFFTNTKNDPFTFHYKKDKKGNIIQEIKTEVIEIYLIEEKMPDPEKEPLKAITYFYKNYYLHTLPP